MKNVVLGVPLKLLKHKGAVCKEVAEAMAIGALKMARANLAVAVTGVAGPEPDEDGNPVGLSCFVLRRDRIARLSQHATSLRDFRGRQL